MVASSGDEQPLIKPGIYALKFTGWETRKMFSTAKVVLNFRVVDYGEAFDVPLSRHYNAKRLSGKAGKSGGFVVGKCHDLAREFFMVLEKAGQPISGLRLDRLPLSRFDSLIIVGKVATVIHDSQRKPRQKALHYSVVSELIGIKHT